MEKKTLFAMLALVVLGVGAYAVLRAPEKGQRVGPPPRPIPALKAAEITHVEIVSEKQEKTVLEKQGGTWRIVQPKEWPADQAAMKTLTDGLEKLGFGDLVSQEKSKLADLGVEDGKAARLTVKNQSTPLADFYLGKPIAGFNMLRVVGKDEVWQSTGLAPYMINRDPKGWREHVIFDTPQNDVDKLVVEAGPSKLTLQRDGEPKGADTKWKIVEATGDAPKTAAELDLGLVNGAVQAVAQLRAQDFLDDKKPADVGLDKPWLTFTMEAKGKPATLMVGNATGDDYPIKRADAPQIYSVKKFAIERALHRPVDYREKSLARVAEADLAEVSITVGNETTTLKKEGTAWKSTGKTAVDDAKVKPVVSAFEHLDGSSFSTEKDPVKTGLKKPAGIVVLKLKNKSTVTIHVGALTPDKGDYYVQKVGSPDVLLAKKFAIDRFLKKPAELAKGTTAKK
jgi:hypothetical protein